MGVSRVSQDSLFPMKQGAIFSPCRTWRYVLHRIWDEGKPFCGFIGLNPSTADETKSDPTVTRCIRFCKDWGYGGYLMFNVFGFRATDPRVMAQALDPLGPENNRMISEHAARCEKLVAAWGNHKLAVEQGAFLCRFLERQLWCLERNKNGSPKHPLYVKADVKPIIYYQPGAKT